MLSGSDLLFQSLMTTFKFNKMIMQRHRATP